MSRIISICNYKGGVSKSTLAYNLAGCVAYQGKPVAILETDPSAVLTKARANCPKDTRLEVILDKTFSIRHKIFDTGWKIFIDTPPLLDEPIQKCLSISELIIIPITTPVDLESALPIFKMAEEAKQKANPSLKVAIVITRAQPRTDNFKTLIAITEKEKLPLCKNYISDSVILAYALIAGQPLCYYRFNHPIVNQYFNLAKELRIL